MNDGKCVVRGARVRGGKTGRVTWTNKSSALVGSSALLGYEK